MASEADLDAEIKSLSILSEHPELYDEFVKLGSVKSLVSLLFHENSDIAIDAIQIISELTDEDVAAEDAQWDALVDAMVSFSFPSPLFLHALHLLPPLRALEGALCYLPAHKLEADILELLAQNFARLDESNESDRSGVYHALSTAPTLPLSI
jgi:beta-catenin-like protein 1